MRLTYVISAAALALATAANGQAGTPAGDIATGDGATVTREAAQAMVDQIVHPVDGQIARYRDGVCPSVIGVNDDFARRVANRIRAVSAAAGAPVAPEGCDGNLVVIFTVDPAKFFRSVEQDHPGWLQGLSRFSRNELASSDAPILAWQMTTARNADGQTGNELPNRAQTLTTMRVRDSSFARPVTRRTIETAFVLVSLTAIDGRPLFQIADNITLRALTPLDVPRSSTVPTVLTAFAQGSESAPAMMTSADLAFIRAIYSGDGSQTAITERARVAEVMGGNAAG